MNTVLDKGSVGFEFAGPLLAGGGHVSGERARSLAGRLPPAAAMFKSRDTGTWPTRPDNSNVFISCLQVLAPCASSRACLVTVRASAGAQNFWLNFCAGVEACSFSSRRQSENEILGGISRQAERPGARWRPTTQGYLKVQMGE